MILFSSYKPIHFLDCLTVFERNIPDYFHPDELDDYRDYLENFALENYWVCHVDDRFIGCGGIHIVENVGRLVYGMIDPNYHRMGFGRELLNFRLLRLSNSPLVKTIRLETTPKAKGFFKSLGFVEDRTVKQGIANCMDQVDMTLKL